MFDIQNKVKNFFNLIRKSNKIMICGYWIMFIFVLPIMILQDYMIDRDLNIFLVNSTLKNEILLISLLYVFVLFIFIGFSSLYLTNIYNSKNACTILLVNCIVLALIFYFLHGKMNEVSMILKHHPIYGSWNITNIDDFNFIKNFNVTDIKYLNNSSMRF